MDADVKAEHQASRMSEYRRRMRVRRAAEGRCQKCGYDLGPGREGKAACVPCIERERLRRWAARVVEERPTRGEVRCGQCGKKGHNRRACDARQQAAE